MSSRVRTRVDADLGAMRGNRNRTRELFLYLKKSVQAKVVSNMSLMTHYITENYSVTNTFPTES
jgi:hypothetical protein